MEKTEGDKAVQLTFLKHDWFQKGNDKVAVHLYVKEVTECNVEFTEDCTRVLFSTTNLNFIKIHGNTGEKENGLDSKVNFSYSIATREKIVPHESSFRVKKSVIELVLVKVVPSRWASLEKMKLSLTDPCKVPPSNSVLSANQTTAASPCSGSENNCNNIDTKVALKSTDGISTCKSANSASTVTDNGIRRSSSNQMPSKAFESMQLLGGKSTPVLKKPADSDQKPDKETSTATDQQSLTSTRDAESKKNVNKAVSFRTEALGLTGLENYANNCYMNVVIQVMANLPEMREYFRGENFMNSLSTNNPLSSGGRVAKAFSEVINALWSESKAVVRPQVLKNIMGKRCSLFMGSQQCDAQEFFATLLDNLHEDLKQSCRLEKTNENSSKDDDGVSSSERPNTAWDVHFKRNNSIIVKLFHGQMVSKLTCQGCHKKSVTYEACAQVSLPIPMVKNKLRVLVLFRDSSKRPFMTSLQISSPHAQLWHFLNTLEKRVGIPAHCLRALQVSRGSQISVFDENSPISAINSSKIVVACEVKDEKEADLIWMPCIQNRPQPVRHSNCGQCNKSQSDLELRLKRCTRCMNIAYCSRECQTRHWPVHQKDCRKGYKAAIGLPFCITLSKSKLNYDTLATNAANFASISVVANRNHDKDTDSSESDQEDKNRLPKQEVCTNTAKTSDNTGRPLSSSSELNEEKNRLSKSDESLSSLSASDDDSRTLLASESDKSDRNRSVKVEGASKTTSKINEQFLIKAFHKPDQEPTLVSSEDFKIDLVASACYLSIEWQNHNVKEKDMKDLQASVNVIPDSCMDEESGDSEKCTIADCLAMFMEPDRIHESDGWKCPKCKTVQAVKKEMALSYPPPILLVHFKRFTYASYGQKVSKPIHYPLSGFDLSNHIAEETRESLNIPPVYDLTGVICHRGSMGIGHYTCMVQTLGLQGQTDIGWRYFDDDHVTKLPEDNVVCSSAYVLVYRMRGITTLLNAECPFQSLLSVGADVKQDKATASSKTFSRQISGEGNSKEKSKHGKVESPRLPLKRANSTDPALQSNLLDEAQAQRKVHSESRLTDPLTDSSDNSEQLFDDVFDGQKLAPDCQVDNATIIDEPPTDGLLGQAAGEQTFVMETDLIGNAGAQTSLNEDEVLYKAALPRDETRFQNPFFSDKTSQDSFRNAQNPSQTFLHNDAIEPQDSLRSMENSSQDSLRSAEPQLHSSLDSEVNIDNIDIQLTDSKLDFDQGSGLESHEINRNFLINSNDITENDLD